MKNIFKKIMIGFGILTAILIIISAGYFLKLNAEIKKMKPLETKEVIQNVFSVRDSFVNLYLIKNGDSFISIDAGTNAKNILKELGKLNIDPLKVKAVFLTHTHFDHTAGLSLFPNAKIYLSKNEKFVSKKTLERLENNSVLEIDGIKIKCIYTPGHTAGSVCYIVNDNILFSGDNFSIINGKGDVFVKLFNSNTELQKVSIRNLKNFTGINYIFSAHHGSSDNFKELFKDFK